MSQARTSIGFDFGTTNSLVSVISGDRVVNVVDESGRPYPSVVRYEGEEVIVGQEARQALEEVGIGVHGNTIRSPKFLLGQEAVSVGGVERSPVNIVAAVIRHVRAESLRSGQRQRLGNLDQGGRDHPRHHERAAAGRPARGVRAGRHVGHPVRPRAAGRVLRLLAGRRRPGERYPAADAA